MMDKVSEVDYSKYDITPNFRFQIQFIQFHHIHYKSKRPIGYRISHSTLYQTLMHKDSIHKVTIIIWAGNKMSFIYGYSIDWLIDLIDTVELFSVC